ncbi:glutamate carboxypeptidase [Alkalibacillus filiformis]|uniref:Glutamate carboxypeptidase n=1 Tax=Alkalibacillus filiformis TaxID=200990 RepID=A0ABU0DUM7_9BACI|nr:M20 family metallopeptidase [Alkalibacillus filiformis]MDQ0352141.1 glutamate carboxypeptidase [Alkalibacillus filiformis]
MDDIVRYLQDKEGEMVSLLRDLVLIESPSSEPHLTEKMGNYLSEKFIEMTGGTFTKLPSDDYSSHIRAEWGEGERQLLIVTHFDTVWPEGTLEDMPFEIKDGKAYGPGTFDMKGGIVQALYAIQSLKDLNKHLNKKIVLMMTSDEELGSPTSKDYIMAEAEKSDAVFVLEPSQGSQGALKTARKGVGTYDITIHGVSSHAGIEPEKGASAIEELAEQITYLSNLTDLDKGTSVNVGIIDGGSSKNVIAEEAHAVVDVRVQTQEEMDRVALLIEQIKSHDEDIEIDIEGEIYRPPLERTDEIEALFDRASDLARDYLGFELEEESTGGGSDANFTASLSPTLDGLGAVGDGAHAQHEHLVVKEMPKRSALLAMLLCDYGSN